MRLDDIETAAAGRAEESCRDGGKAGEVEAGVVRVLMGWGSRSDVGKEDGRHGAGMMQAVDWCCMNTAEGWARTLWGRGESGLPCQAGGDVQEPGAVTVDHDLGSVSAMRTSTRRRRPGPTPKAFRPEVVDGV